jgi:hypothetical protein
MRKVELHMDALIAIIVVFILCFSAVLFQRYQYSDLLQDNVDLTWDNENLKVNLDYTSSKLEECNKLK